MPEEIKKSITIFKTPSWGIFGVAFLVMLICKCGGWCPDLSWWIVTAPLWGPWALYIGFFIAFYAFLFIVLGIVGTFAIVLGLIETVFNKIKGAFKRKENKDEYRLHS